MVNTISGLIGGIFFLLVLSAVGAAVFPDELPYWGYFAGLAVLCAVLSVFTFRKQSDK